MKLSASLNEHLANARVLLAAGVVVCIAVVWGLTWLSAKNLDGSVAARQARMDHTTAIRNLMFRD